LLSIASSNNIHPATEGAYPQVCPVSPGDMPENAVFKKYATIKVPKRAIS
jgi:hypothetical protein